MAPQIKLAQERTPTLIKLMWVLRDPLSRVRNGSLILGEQPNNWNSGPLGPFGRPSLTSIKDVACFQFLLRTLLRILMTPCQLVITHTHTHTQRSYMSCSATLKTKK